jgi:hypothetical protein
LSAAQDDLVDWCVVHLMMEGHQQYSELMRMPTQRLVELAVGVSAVIREKNRMMKPQRKPRTAR